MKLSEMQSTVSADDLSEADDDVFEPDGDPDTLDLLEQAHIMIRLFLDPKFEWHANYRNGIIANGMKLESDIKHHLDKLLKEDVQ